MTHVDSERAIAQLIHSTSVALDEQRHGDFLASTSADFRYRITAYSPEIRKQMLWFEHDRAGLAGLYELLPKHHVDHAVWLRHVVPGLVTRHGDDSAAAVTNVAIYHTLVDVGDTHVEAGSTRLFAVGRYHDELRLVGGQWLLTRREVRLQTRQLGIGTHVLP